MPKYVYTYSVKNLVTGKTIAKGFESKGQAINLGVDAMLNNPSGDYTVRQHRTLRAVA